MITKCRFCNYQKEKDLSKDILKVLADKHLPHEDYMLWLERLVKTQGLEDYRSVKIHMGIKHKHVVYEGIVPELELSEREVELINPRVVK